MIWWLRMWRNIRRNSAIVWNKHHNPVAAVVQVSSPRAKLIYCALKFELHSMHLKRTKGVTEINIVDIGKDVHLLMLIIVTEKEWWKLSSVIQYLQQGGLDIISPWMLRFLRSVVENMNDERARKEHGWISTTREKRNACARSLLLKIRGFYAKFRAYYCPKPFTSGAIKN